MILRTGDRIGEWIVDGPLGEGGMGTVWRVHSALSSRVDAAMKVMKPTNEASARARFVREAEALAALRHPAIVRVMGFSEDPVRGLLYLVMELAEGPTLRQRMASGGMALNEALGIFVPLAAALVHAHQNGVVHRDVKPSNVVLTSDGPRLVDFGIASTHELETLTSSGRMGTLSYMPPELFRADQAVDDKLGDVYALGLMLHEALTGTRVFPGEGAPAAMAAAIAARKLQQASLDPGPAWPERVRELVRASTSATASERPTMAGFHDRLVALLERRATREAAEPRVIPPATADFTVHVPEPRRVSGRRVLLIAGAAFALMGFLMVWPIARVVRNRRAETPVTTTLPAAPVTVAPATPAPTPEPVPSARPTVEPAPSVVLAGHWQLQNVIEHASYAPFVGLRLGYDLDLQQDGSRVWGSGRKVSENGAAVEGGGQTPIGVDGRIEGRRVRLRFTERGAERATDGVFLWEISDDARTLDGRFSSEAASSSGRSTASRGE